MRIAITGATGLVGSYLSEYFRNKKDEVLEISRGKKLGSKQSLMLRWDPSVGDIESGQLEGCDVVIHLAGASISSRWEPKYKTILRSSRIDSTRFLSRTIAALKQKPKLLISASAIGYYGNRPSDQSVTESDSNGNDFLAKLCHDWEKETVPAQEAGIRVVHLRTGVVLAKNGGAIAKMLPIFQLGLGGVLGNGRQMMSWVALGEIPYIIEHIMRTTQLTGPINIVSPKPVSNQEFTKVLGDVIRRPTILPVPSFGIELLFGEMGRTLLLEGLGVVPQKLLQSGYKFRYDDLKLALTSVLKP